MNKNLLRVSARLTRNIFHVNNKARQTEINNKISIDVYKIINKISKNKNINISGYYPINDELDCTGILNNLKKYNDTFSFSLPVVKKNTRLLDFYVYDLDASQLINGKYTKIPPIKCKVKPSIMLVPFLGFTDARYRLGYGGGYYDYTLEQYGSNSISIGIGYDVQKIDNMPIDDHDIPLNYIVTESFIYHNQ